MEGFAYMPGRVRHAGWWDDRTLETEMGRNSLVYVVYRNDSCRLGSSRMLFVFLIETPLLP